jgi:hypothetical protein
MKGYLETKSNNNMKGYLETKSNNKETINLQTVSLEIEIPPNNINYDEEEKVIHHSNSAYLNSVNENVEEIEMFNNFNEHTGDINDPFETSYKRMSQIPKKYNPDKFYNYDKKPVKKLVLPYLEIKNQIKSLLNQLIKLHINKNLNMNINLQSVNKLKVNKDLIDALSSKPKVLYIRKSVSKMSNEDWNNFKKAWNTLNKNGILSKFVITHQNTIVDRTSMFLPWYRWFIALMEDALQSEGSCLPYWDMTENNILPFSLLYFTPDVDIKENIEKVTRNFKPKFLPTFEDVKDTLQNVTFEESKIKDNTNYFNSWFKCYKQKESSNGLSIDLQSLNDKIHIAIGGNMSNIITSPCDPLFYMVQAYIDSLWYIWNKKGNYDTIRDCLLPGFENTTVKNLSNVEKITTLGGCGYTYELNNNLKYMLNNF